LAFERSNKNSSEFVRNLDLDKDTFTLNATNSYHPAGFILQNYLSLSLPLIENMKNVQKNCYISAENNQEISP